MNWVLCAVCDRVVYLYIICTSPKTHKLIRCGIDWGDRNSICTMSVWKCVGCYLPSLPIGCVRMAAKFIHPASVLLPLSLSLHSHSFFSSIFYLFILFLRLQRRYRQAVLSWHVIYTAPHPSWSAKRGMDRNEQQNEKKKYGIIAPKCVRCEWANVSSNSPATKSFFGPKKNVPRNFLSRFFNVRNAWALNRKLNASTERSFRRVWS